MNITVQVGNGRLVTAPIEAWIVAFMSKLSATEQIEVCEKAEKIAAEAVTIHRPLLPRQHQVLSLGKGIAIPAGGALSR